MKEKYIIERDSGFVEAKTKHSSKGAGFLHHTSGFEPYFFYLLVVAHLLPIIVSGAYFITADGPAHLYNARLIVDMFLNPESVLAEFYVFNRMLVPNWIGHFIMSITMLFLPAFIAEKVILAAYLIFLPLSFRYVFKSFEIKGKYMLYFIFPFTYSFLLYFGFYNFQLGLVLFFLTLGFWARTQKNGFTTKRIIILAALLVLVYFSHLFVLFVLLAVIGILNIFKIYNQHVKGEEPIKKTIKPIVYQILAFLPALFLTAYYLVAASAGETSSKSLPAADLWNMLMQIQPAKGISYGKEGNFTKWIFYLFLLIPLVQFIQHKREKQPRKQGMAIIWGTISLMFFVGLFVAPDESNAAGFISSRLVLFFFLFFILFLASNKSPVWLKITAFIIINYVNLALLNIYVQTAIKHKPMTIYLKEAASHLEPYSIVWPVNDHDYWLYGHFPNYLGADKPMIIIENYEAALDYFPLKWNYPQIPQLHAGVPDFPVHAIPLASHPASKQIDYIFLVSNPEKTDPGIQEQHINQIIDKYYKLTYVSDDGSARLYSKL